GVAPWLQALGRLERLRERWVERLEAHRKAEIPGRGPVREALEGLFGVPGWWLDAGPWARVGEAVRELGRLRRPQELTLRVQAHRAERPAVLRELRDAGVPVSPTPRSPWGIRVAGRHNVLALPAVREGRVEVQDEGSQLVACLCDPKPGERVLDFCAGGGGKALALAAAMGGRGEVVAHDADRARLRDTRRRARRAGLGNIRVEASAEAVGRRAPYDLVLVDVPCSSSGTLRRNPDVAWRWNAEDLGRLTAVQAEILDRVAGWVRPGGFLVYVTCSLLVPENQAQIEAFLARHPEFAPAPLGDRTGHEPLLDLPGAEAGILRLPANLPRYTGDAFFLARLGRLGS
ncbi:MAG: RsmB/NOP family class I SAM-dependent RNA methyltransferase, partial [Candidatus Dadabacteria bacterium]